jgi:RNA polymerase sigma-70 factor (ECF subfamily)
MTPPPPDSSDDFLRLHAKHEPQIRAFVRAGVESNESVAEIMQETSIVAWQKFSDLKKPESDFGRWMCVIARYEILKYRQTKARDRMILNQSIVEKIVDEGLDDFNIREKYLSTLDQCLGKLSKANSNLLLLAYDRTQSIKMIANSLRKTPDALYQKLRRLRFKLTECMSAEHSLDQS